MNLIDKFKKENNGAIPSIMDERDRLFTKIASNPKNKNISFPMHYMSKFPPLVYDQGNSSMCVACSIALIRHIQTYLQTGKSLPFDPLFVYAARTEKMYQGEGMSPRDAMSIVKNKGITTREDNFIYCTYPESISHLKKNEEEWYKLAEPYKIDSYYSVKTKEEVKLAIMKCGAVTGMFPDYKCLHKPNTSNGISYIPYSIFDKINKFNGYHEMTIIGWHRTYWIVQNSWGKDYGVNGVVYIPMEYPTIELWTCMDTYNESLV